MNIKFDEKVTSFIKSTYNCVNGTWYYSPYFLKDNGDGTFEKVGFDKLPKEVRDTIIENREKQVPDPDEQYQRPDNDDLKDIQFNQSTKP